LWNHFQKTRDIEFIARVYPNLVMKTSEFLLSYIDETTGLPKPSFDIWEERFGVFSATAATVQAALAAAAKFAKVFYDSERQKRLSQAAERMRAAMVEHLYDKEKGCFLKAIYPDGTHDNTADSSILFIVDYGVFPANDPLVVSSMNRLVNNLWLKTETGGMSRYKDDDYYRISANAPCNPWFICTLWLAKWRIARANSMDELKDSLKVLSWAVQHASKSGIIGEQVNPFNGESISVSPLIWSHAEFVLTVSQYLEKYQLLKSGPGVK
jgi:GH15 family glucan-1,4-alpha-glucosidase